MSSHDFLRKLTGEVELDLCFACQGIWFDEYESLQLAPAGVIGLFKLIHEHRDDQRLPLADPLCCPRCKERLIHSQDRVKSGLFNYMRCGQHGRFITFSQFMIEKGFVRQLAPAEIKALAARIGTVHCTGCGSPVDIRTESVCSHCASPISILDPEAVEKALVNYENQAKQIAHRDPEKLADAVLAIERQRSQSRRLDNTRPFQIPEPSESITGDLLLAGLGIALKALF